MVKLTAQQKEKFLPLWRDDSMALDADGLYVALDSLVLEDGTLLSRAPALISVERLKQIKHLPLQRSIDHCVYRVDGLTNTELKSRLLTFVESYEDILAIHEQTQHGRHIDLIFKHLRLEDQVRAQLTVLDVLLPHIFNSALFCSWLNALLSVSLEYPPVKIYNAFLAGLLRDIGMIALPQSVTEKRGAFSQEEWRFMVEHPRLSVAMIGGTQQFDGLVVEAILAHHETTSGSGYPMGISTAQADPLVQMTGFADQVFRIWLYQLTPNNKNLFDIESVLQVHAAQTVTSTRLAEKWLINILQKCHSHRAARAGGASIPVQVVLDRDYLKQKAVIFREAHQMVSTLRNINTLKQMGPKAKSLVHLLKDVDSTVAAIGLNTSALEDSLNDDDISQAELQELNVALEETLWKYRHIYRVLSELSAECQNPRVSMLVAEVFNYLHIALQGPDSFLASLDSSV